MPREKMYAKDVATRNADGTPAEFHNGIEQRDYSESEFHALPDEVKATMAASPLFDLRHDAPAEAEKVAAKVEKAAPTDVTSQSMAPDTLIVQSAPAPAKDGEKKA